MNPYNPKDSEKNSCRRIIGMQQNEASIVNTLPAAVLEESSEVLDNDLESGDEDTLPDLNQQPKLHQLLTHQNFKLLEQILEEFQHHNEVKWSQWTVDDLFPALLRNPHNLMKYLCSQQIWRSLVGLFTATLVIISLVQVTTRPRMQIQLVEPLKEMTL